MDRPPTPHTIRRRRQELDTFAQLRADADRFEFTRTRFASVSPTTKEPFTQHKPSLITKLCNIVCIALVVVVMAMILSHLLRPDSSPMEFQPEPWH